MAFISILKSPDDPALRIVASDDPLAYEARPTDEGIFVETPSPVLFQRSVPEAQPLLIRLEALLDSSRVPGRPDAYDCPAPIAIRAIEVAYAELWPTRQLQCPDCRHYFVIPYLERRRMYLACPHCHNPQLNPSWDSA